MSWMSGREAKGHPWAGPWGAPARWGNRHLCRLLLRGKPLHSVTKPEQKNHSESRKILLHSASLLLKTSSTWLVDCLQDHHNPDVWFHDSLKTLTHEKKSFGKKCNAPGGDGEERTVQFSRRLCTFNLETSHPLSLPQGRILPQRLMPTLPIHYMRKVNLRIFVNFSISCKMGREIC